MGKKQFILLVIVLILIQCVHSCDCVMGGNPQMFPYISLPRVPRVFDTTNNFCDRTTSKIDEVRIVPLCAAIPAGWRIMTYEEGSCMKEELKSLLTQWSIVAFDHGELEGPGYGYKINPTYGSECGEKFIIKNTCGRY
jgi:hypothetical protein